MNKLLLCVLCVLALFATVTPCFADTVNGVLAEERVVNLPQDAGKWYVSVVGNTNDARYNEILGWFESNASLTKLKNQVHFCPVTADTALYQERYASNVKGLPTVRMQRADGTVVYEAAGRNIPLTAPGLNGALAGSAQDAQGLLPLLPWRRNADKRLNNLEHAKPQPQPQPQPDPPPQPLDDNATPDDSVTPDGTDCALAWWLLTPLCTVSLLGGLVLGYGKKLKEKWLPTGK